MIPFPPPHPIRFVRHIFLLFLYQIFLVPVAFSHASHTLMFLSCHGTRVLLSLISVNFSLPALQRKRTFESLARAPLCIAAHFPYDYAKIFVLSKTFVCIYYTRSIRIGSTNKKPDNVPKFRVTSRAGGKMSIHPDGFRSFGEFLAVECVSAFT